MSENLDNIIDSTHRLVRRAKLRLYWEVYAPTLAPGFLAVALFTLGASLGIWQWIGDPIRLIALLVTLVFVVRSVHRAVSLRRPTHSDARRRVETDSGQAHRPLDVLDDRPALAAEVWPSHQKKALSQARKLRRASPRPTLSPIDPYYLRIIAPALLILASLYMAGFSFERLRRAVTPSWQSPIRASQVSYEAWIDPPSYTGRPPIYFKDGANVAAPQGSEFVARISGSKTAPRPRLSQGWMSRFLTPKRLGAKSFEISETMNKTAKIEFRVGLSRKVFTLNVGDDLAPEVEIIEPPKADKRDRLTLVYGLKDDFGVETLQLEMALMEEGTLPEAAFDDVSIFANISLPSSRQTSVEKAKTAIDLSKTRYAGRKVIGRLVATDGAGQSGYSEPVWFIVPDKIFVEPLAKAVAEQRVIVMAGLDETYAPAPAPAETPRFTQEEGWNRYQPRGNETEAIYDLHLPWDRAPAPIQRATLLIEAVTDEPAGLFKDPAVFMGLRHARSQMRHAESIAELQGLPDDLWRIALRAEFGVLGSALEEMREAEAALREGIARRAAKREIDTLFDRYNLAVDAYTEELRRKALEEGIQEGDGGGGGEGGGSLDEIQELLKAIEEANAAGDTEGARRALARLAEVLENMQIQLSQGGGGGGGGSPSTGDMSEEEQQQLEDLADLTGKQRDLQDETEQSERDEEEEDAQGDEAEGSDGDGSQGGNAQGLTPQELARRQGELRELLDSLGDSLASGEGESEGQKEGSEPGGGQTAEAEDGEEGGPGSEDGEQGAGGSSEALQQQFAEGIGAAGQAMRRSEDALQDGDLEAAGDAQEEAIRALREAGEALAEAVSERGEGREGGEDGNDPLGRSDGGFDDGTDTADIDNQDNATRSRELLEELRKRAAEQDREIEERQYLDRLLKRF